jgi:CRISPR-associated endonuclease/helicase Cas3
MKTLKSMLAEPLRVENLLENAAKYLAHLPREGKNGPIQLKPETLGEHMNLVLNCALKIVNQHGLERIIDDLIAETVQNLAFSNYEIAEDFVRQLFANALVFHDFGKINPYFQADRMKNAAFFSGKGAEIFKPKHGHSELGAFIFVVFHLEKLGLLAVDNELDLNKLAALTLVFSNSILLHHSPNLVKPTDKVTKSQFLEKRAQLEKFIRLYRDFPLPNDSNAIFENLEEIFKELVLGKSSFELFALLRLNFSLLTAADYLATGQYSYDLELKTDAEWGILSEKQREHIIHAARTSKSWNTEAYQLFDSKNYAFKNPQEPTGDNLNLLRTEMAVRVLQQLEKHPEKRLFYLEAPTGGGKTNLSMLAVAELLKQNPEIRKVFYVFPFTTLITQTHKNIKDTLLLEDYEIALMHSRAGFQSNQKAGEEAHEDGLYGNHRLDFLQNLFALYPISLVTHIRFFDILKSNGKEDGYLMHRLANSIVILDEMQSYPPKHWDKMLWMMNEYGRFFNIRFILMSATLPRIDKIKAVKNASGGFPPIEDLLPNAKDYFLNPNFSGRVNFQFDLLKKGEIELDELAKHVLEKSRARSERMDAQGRVFTIIEFIFKKSATKFRSFFPAEDEGFFDKIFVLSGTVLESRRREIISFLKKNQKTKGLKVLLITTQVVEAGVDIDMDLGFKNISLVDSDEQLAGRVNRNVDKKGCEVWLFNANDAGTLYKNDTRFQVLKGSPEIHESILETKDFGQLYDLVFEKIDEKNKSETRENFFNYLDFFKTLDFPEVDRKFQLIEQKTLSIFVPLHLPILVLNEKGENEAFFNKFELKLLETEQVFNKNDSKIDGVAIWKLYKSTLADPKADFISKKIDQKAMQGILAKFTFSLFDSPKNRAALAHWCNAELNLDNYFYLSHFDQIYDLETGLKETKMAEFENHL